MSIGLVDPMAMVSVCHAAIAEVEAQGFTITTSSDFGFYAQEKKLARDKLVSPMFDPAVNDFSRERAFWMSATSSDGKCAAFQAFRLDTVETSLADWCVPYMIGLYMRRQELLVPSHAQPPIGSAAHKLKGRLAYQGELWVDKSFRPRSLTDTFSRIGQLLALIKWRPDAIWALTSHAMASHGYANRLGYGYIERGFLRWEWVSDGMEDVEYLMVAETAAIENDVALRREMSSAGIHDNALRVAAE
jgi:hypothetical protein